MTVCRYQAVEKSRHEFRENARRLVAENEVLRTTVNQVCMIHMKLYMSTQRVL